MKILIVAATEKEISPLLSELKYQYELGKNLKRFLHKSTNVDVLITGVGMVPTAYWLGKTLAENQYNYAINLGIAGSFIPELPIGSLVDVREDILAELGAEDGSQFIPFNSLDLEKDEFLGDGFFTNLSPLDPPSVTTLQKVRGITVNTVHGNEASIAKVYSRLKPMVETMEGAAFLYACSTADLQCLQIRAISNRVEKRNKASWNIPLALENLNSFALQLLNEL